MCSKTLHSTAPSRKVSGPGMNASLTLQDTKAAKELAALKDWHVMVGKDPARAFYGPGHVFAAAELGAVATLLLSDSNFHVNNVDKVCSAQLYEL